MPASPLHLSTSRPPDWRAEFRPLVVTTVVALVVLLNAVGLLIVLRRFAGALSNDLPHSAMLLTALVATATVACVRIAWRRVFSLDETYWDTLVGWGSSLALILLAVGCSYPANHTGWFIWLPLLVADQFWRQKFLGAGKSTSTDDSKRKTGEIVQQLFRVRDDNGCEVVYGTVRADFAVGQRTAVVHVGFCPPLTHIPEIKAESLDGTTARIKVVQALAHGTRLDIRLPAPAETDSHIWIDMAATPAKPQKDHEAI